MIRDTPIPSESDSDFVRLLAKHEPEIRAYIRASLPSPHDVAEVMQNVSVVAWRKFSELENPQRDFARWTCVIARFEIMKFRRGLARDRFVLDDDLVEQLCEEGLSESDLRAKRIEQLETCLRKLPRERREFVMEAYAPGASIKEMAEKRGKKPDALYQLLKRIRRELENCVDRQLNQGEAGV
ncbi:MAG: sigma-70 family RNA polymerase sigma factor [Verrucomicrobiota bacterium]